MPARVHPQQDDDGRDQQARDGELHPERLRPDIEAELAAEHPLIAEAVQVADKAMEAKGVPVKAIETMVLEGVREALSAMKDINATGAAP